MDHLPVEGLVFDGGYPAALVFTPLGDDQGIHGLLPSSRGNAGIAAGQVSFGNLEIQSWLAEGLVLRQNNLGGLVLVGGRQTGAFSGEGINAVELEAALAAADETVSPFHTL